MVRKDGQNQGEETRTKIVEAMRNKPEISSRDYAEMEKECEKAKAEHGTRQIERLYKKLLQSAQKFWADCNNSEYRSGSNDLRTLNFKALLS